jgi:hypothetical protein
MFGFRASKILSGVQLSTGMPQPIAIDMATNAPGSRRAMPIMRQHATTLKQSHFLASWHFGVETMV